MDIRERVMGDQPHDFLHRIAGIVPGYDGYVDRERRRDADKLLRTQLAHRFSEQRDRLNRVQQGLMRSHHMENIAEVDRLAGVLQRFIDRLSTATYGYAGLFDPVKVEAADLDQLYAFDMALASGADQISSAIDSLDAAAGATGQAAELPAAIGRLATVLEDLNQRLNERSDLLTAGRRLPETDYRSLLDNLNQKTATYSGPAQSGPAQGGGALGGQDASPAMALGIEKARAAGGSEGVPTTNLNMQTNQPSDPALGTEIGAAGSAGSSGSGIETASSPVAQPGTPGHDIVEGIEMAPGTGGSAAGNAAAGQPADSPNQTGNG